MFRRRFGEKFLGSSGCYWELLDQVDIAKTFLDQVNIAKSFLNQVDIIRRFWNKMRAKLMGEPITCAMSTVSYK